MNLHVGDADADLLTETSPARGICSRQYQCRQWLAAPPHRPRRRNRITTAGWWPRRTRIVSPTPSSRVHCYHPVIPSLHAGRYITQKRGLSIEIKHLFLSVMKTNEGVSILAVLPMATPDQWGHDIGDGREARQRCLEFTLRHALCRPDAGGRVLHCQVGDGGREPQRPDQVEMKARARKAGQQQLENDSRLPNHWRHRHTWTMKRTVRHNARHIQRTKTVLAPATYPSISAGLMPSHCSSRPDSTEDGTSKSPRYELNLARSPIPHPSRWVRCRVSYRPPRGAPGRRRDCHSAAPSSPCSRCFNMDGEGMSAQ